MVGSSVNSGELLGVCERTPRTWRLAGLQESHKQTTVHRQTTENISNDALDKGSETCHALKTILKYIELICNMTTVYTPRTVMPYAICHNTKQHKLDQPLQV